jgi:hypothetical protein
MIGELLPPDPYVTFDDPNEEFAFRFGRDREFSFYRDNRPRRFFP